MTADGTAMSPDTRAALYLAGLLLKHDADTVDDLPADVQRQWRKRRDELLREDSDDG